MSGSASAPRKKSMWWQAGPFEQWVKEVLISVLVPQGSAVCELMCGSGKDLGKWQRAKPSKYVGIGAHPRLLLAERSGQVLIILRSRPARARDS